MTSLCHGRVPVTIDQLARISYPREAARASHLVAHHLLASVRAACRSGSMDGEERRAASRVAAPADAMSTRMLKLPFLCARPGNVGVQIDSYRAMTMFHRPRCGKFTAHFLGIPFENASMDNYSRVVERTSKRARIVEDRLAKLRARQQEILDDTEQRQRRRGEREAARQRKVWLHHQSLKKRDQRQREEEAAIVIQRYTRGMLGRLERDSCLHDREQDRAAQTLQRSSKAFLRRKRNARRALERQKERQMQAATVLQRQARKRLTIASRKHHQKLGVLESPRRIASDACEAPPAGSVEAEQPAPVDEGDTVSPEIGRDISLDLLFSDSDEDEPSAATSPMPPRFALLDMGTAVSESTHASPRRPQQPKRPVSIKRVGGGFRTTAFVSTKSPVPPTRATRPQQPIRHPTAALSARNRASPSPLMLVRRRPSVPASPGSSSFASDDCGGSRRAPLRRRWSTSTGDDTSVDELQQKPTQEKDQQTEPLGSLLSSSTADGDSHLAPLEELQEANARSHVADS